MHALYRYRQLLYKLHNYAYSVRGFVKVKTKGKGERRMSKMGNRTGTKGFQTRQNRAGRPGKSAGPHTTVAEPNSAATRRVKEKFVTFAEQANLWFRPT